MLIRLGKSFSFGLASMAMSLTVSAQEEGYLAEFERPYGYTEDGQSANTLTHDGAGNRIIGNGRTVDSAPSMATSAPKEGYLAEFERPYGFAYGEENQPFDARTRDSTGNRVIVNGGLLNSTSTLNGGLNTGWGQTQGSSGTTIGNQLNVVTNGNNNTVIIDGTQINNGDQTVILDIPSSNNTENVTVE